VLLRGRQADRAGHAPSVEALKELVYADFDDAELLTGAFRLLPAHAGAARVLVQAASAATAVAGLVQLRLQQRAARAGLQVEIAVVAPDLFPGRPQLDFERKLAYRHSDGV
jgi:hypothetical protein